MATSRRHTALLSSLQQRLQASPLCETTAGRASSFGVMMSYTGTVDGDMIHHLVQLAERSLSHSGSSRKEVKRVLYVLIEAVQNVLHHGHIDNKGEIVLYLTVEHTPLGTQVHCGNLIDKETAKELSERLGELNAMDHAALRRSYVDALCQGTIDSMRGNAGLGLISMAKRSKGPIEFQSHPHDDELDIFQLTVTIRD